MATTASNKRKKAVAATVAVVALLLAGTFAWTSISQQALNESAGIVNVGGRLHDDFDGENKDVYVENFTDPLQGGQPIYARVRLDEYMEVGQEAGSDVDLDGDGSVEALPVLADTERGNVSTWKTHVPEDQCEICALEGTCEIHEHWTWTMGGKTTYMPTFNKDKDSKEADINGTYQGTKDGDKVYYDDYVIYATEDGEAVDMNGDAYNIPQDAENANQLTEANTEITEVTGTAFYDNDTDKIEDSHDMPVNDANIRTETETHTAKETALASVMTMQEWLDGGSVPGPYWVYDEDGWAYWAQAIMPGQATGLLLDGIEMTKNPGEKCYYGINVIGEFATVGDWEYFNDGAGLPEGSNALLVMETAASVVPTVTVTNVDGATTVEPGDKVQFSASVTTGGASTFAEGGFTWSVVDSKGEVSKTSSVDDTGLLTVGAKEASEQLYVMAEYSECPGAVGFAGVEVYIPVPPEIAAIADVEAGSTTTVTIDEKEWYVVAKENGRGLLMAKEPVRMAFDSDSKIFDGSDLDNYLNSTYLENLPLLNEYSSVTSIMTSAGAWGENDIVSDHKVFILSFDDFANDTYRRDSRPDKSISDFVSEDIVNAISSENSTIFTRTRYTDEWYEESGVITEEEFAIMLTAANTYGSKDRYLSTTEVPFYPVMWVRYGEGIDITNNTPEVYAEQGNEISLSAVKTTVTGETVQNPDVTWSISGNNEGDGGTTIDTNGKVTIGNEAHGTVITVTATTTGEKSTSGTFTLTVTVPSLEMEIQDSRYYFNPEESGYLLNINIPEGCSLENEELDYTVTGGTGNSVLGPEGWLEIGADEAIGTKLTLTVASKDGRFSDSVEIEVGVPTITFDPAPYIILEDNCEVFWNPLIDSDFFNVRITRDGSPIELEYEFYLENGQNYEAVLTPDYSINQARFVAPNIPAGESETYTVGAKLKSDPNVKHEWTFTLKVEDGIK